MKYSEKNKSVGFTLIELLLVVIIIGVLSGVILSVVNVSGLRARARDTQRAGDLKKIQTALELYFADFRGYPQNAGTFELVRTTGILGSAINTNYIKNIPTDPRGGEAMPSTQCTISNYGYYYKTDTGTSGIAPRYVLATFMETATSADQGLCSKLVNCASGAVSGCNCGNPCYGVENPL